MNTIFEFKWKRFLFWRTEKVVGFRHEVPRDRMLLFYLDGSIYEIPNWNKCYCKLGVDYARLLLAKMEQQTGQPIASSIKG